MRDDFDRDAEQMRLDAALAAERARIRQELLAWLEQDALEAGATPHYLLAESLRAALDRICPEEG